MRRSVDVCAAVISDLTYDARVWKQVRSLVADGRSVKLIGCAYELPQTRRRVQDGAAVVEVSLGSRSGNISLPGRLRTLLGVWLEIVRTPARVYHAHNVHVAPAAWLASRIRRAGLVYDGHELYGGGFDEDMSGSAPPPGTIERLGARLAFAVERFVVRRASFVITTNESRARILHERHGRAEVTVLQNVPALVDEVTPLDPGFEPGRRTILYQGGIYASGRAFRETIFALPLLEDVDFAILGFGREHDLDLIRRWAGEAGVADRVRLLPPRPFDELVRTASAATIGIVPIRARTPNSLYGDTNKLFEYLMAGLPVVASEIPEVARVVGSGDPPVGELFDPSSSESIAKAIRTVLDDRYGERRQEARRLALSRYNWSVEERALLAIYGRLLCET